MSILHEHEVAAFEDEEGFGCVVVNVHRRPEVSGLVLRLQQRERIRRVGRARKNRRLEVAEVQESALSGLNDERFAHGSVSNRIDALTRQRKPLRSRDPELRHSPLVGAPASSDSRGDNLRARRRT